MSAKQHFLLCCIHSQSKIKHFVPFWRTSFSLDQSRSQLKKKKVASRIDLQSIIKFLETSWARHKWKFYFKESICTNWVPGFNPDPASSSRLDDSVMIGMFPVMLKLGKIVERKKKTNYWIQRNTVHTLAWSGIPGDSKKGVTAKLLYFLQVTWFAPRVTWLAAVHLNGGRVPEMTYSESIKVRTYLNNITWWEAICVLSTFKNDSHDQFCSNL